MPPTQQDGYPPPYDRQPPAGCLSGCAVALLWMHRLVWRHRATLKPFGLALGVLVVTVAVRTAYGYRLAWQPFVLLGGAAVGAAVGLWFFGGHVRLDRRVERAYAAAVAVACGIWAVSACYRGPLYPPMLLALLLGTLGGAVPWWWHRRIRRRTWSGIQRWKADLEQHESGSTVGRPRFDSDGGCAIPWELPPGRTIDDVRPAVGRLESLLDLRPGAIEIDQDQARKRLVWLRISPRDPHKQALAYPGPPRDATIIRPVTIGRYLDGGPTSTALLGLHALIAGTTGSGKALALDTPIPIPTGWTTMGELQAGDIVFGDDGKPCRVTQAYAVLLDRACYKVEFDDGTVIVADGEHQWETTDRAARVSLANAARHDGRISVLRDRVASLDAHMAAGRLDEPATIAELAAELKGHWTHIYTVAKRAKVQPVGTRKVMVQQVYRATGRTVTKPYSAPVYLRGDVLGALRASAFRNAYGQQAKRTGPRIVTTEQIRSTLKDGVHTNHAVRVAGPLTCPDADLPVDPYVLGCWLGDGKTTSGEITAADPEILEAIREAGYSVKHYGKLAYGIGSGFRVALRRLGVFGNKHIPSVYLRASYQQRLALLQGLMDTDGTVSKIGSCEFQITHRVLAEQTLELIISLGIKARLRTRTARLNGVDCGTAYRIKFTTQTPVFRLPRKLLRQKQAGDRSTQQQRYIVDVRPVLSVPVRCIQVDSPSHLYLAGQGCVPTHNSGVLNVVVAELAACPDVVLWGCDLKHGLELGPWEPVFGRVATTPDQAADLLEAAVRVQTGRGQEMARRKIRTWPTSPTMPALVVLIDEHKPLGGNKRAIAAIETLTSQGRAMAVSLIDTTQYPTVPALGSSLIAPQCAVKVCLRVNTPGEANVILGPGSASAGWKAHEIPKGKPGTLYLDAPGADSPRLARAYHVTDATVKRMARAYTGRRPTLDLLSEHAVSPAGSPGHSPAGSPGHSPANSPLHSPPRSPASGPPVSPTAAHWASPTPRPPGSPPDGPPASPLPGPGGNGHGPVGAAGEGDPVAVLLEALQAAGERGTTVAELAVATGMRKTWVYDRLGELATAGRVVRGPHSRWYRHAPEEGGLQTR